ncbi:carboxymuconolactone decarboxylase family protein [Streptomyces sviceus]|uniref:carboxymuconolactone decarboxylase family protein n=1 Tax=Streptomyces sviceus TaxID=285530 RepID=UPI003316F882
MDVNSGVRVPLIDEADATGHLAELYERAKKVTSLDFVPDMFRLVSSKPELLETMLAGYNGVFNHGNLPRQTRELISAWTSKVNQCPYCVGTHNFFLQVFGGSEELAHAIEASDSPDDLPVDERTRVLLRLVTKLSHSAYRITDEDWQVALDAGWSTDELLEAFFCAALFNFITRLVDGLGLGTTVTQSRISQQELPDDSSSTAAAAAD